MPLGFQRLNERTQRPSTNINFIKSLPGPDHDTAHDFLSRIAAISQPITRSNYINVMSIEEFPPNREFWGRNFNNGECIQLVLKSPSTGQWLSFRFVQKVFMHELAHVHQMNHGKEFWKLRNKYAEELEVLWDKGFVGEGLWGRGRNLYDGQIADGAGLLNADLQLVGATCGGTFRGFRGRGKRRRTAKPKESYREQKERRLKKKFGEGGQSLGDDDEKRIRLEKGRKLKGKPRVAGSNRGRDLRVAAALARFEVKTQPEVKPADEDGSEYETDYGSDFDEAMQAKDKSGKGLVDANGNRLVKVCEGEDDAGGEDARREMEELGTMSQQPIKNDTDKVGVTSNAIVLDEADNSTASESESDDKYCTPATSTSSVVSTVANTSKAKPDPLAHRIVAQPDFQGPISTSKPRKDSGDASKPAKPLSTLRKANTSAKVTPAPPGEGPTAVIRDVATNNSPGHALVGSSACPVCSLENEADALNCMACAHVLRPGQLQHHWKCLSEVCKDGIYINSVDVTVCGLCRAAKP